MSRAALAGWLVHILNDHLIVRTHTGYFAAPTPVLAGAASAAASPFAVRALMRDCLHIDAPRLN